MDKDKRFSEVIGRRLADARKEAGLDIPDAAQLAEVSEARLDAIEAGDGRAPTAVEVYRLARLYGAQVNHIMCSERGVLSSLLLLRPGRVRDLSEEAYTAAFGDLATALHHCHFLTETQLAKLLQRGLIETRRLVDNWRKAEGEEP